MDSAFLDDFYAECDEHLSEVRRAISELESLPLRTEIPGAVSGALARHLHSLKGILGMADLPECERLTHATEDYGRVLLQDQKRPPAEAVETLRTVVAVLEQAVAAHREKKPLPELASVQARVNALLRERSEPGRDQARGGPIAEAVRDPGVQEKVRAARDAGKKVLMATFAPTPELNRAGVNVNTVRARLQELGRFIQSVPRIEPGGGIVFEFVLEADQDPGDLGRWNTQGLSVCEVTPARAPVPHHWTGVVSGVEAGPSSSASPAYVTPSHIVRVDLSRLDELMRAMGEMVVHRGRLEEVLGRVLEVVPAKEGRELQEISDALGRELRRLRDGLMRVRLVPVAEIFERMGLVVRDLTREKGRKIRLETEGRETQIDKYIVERLKDPFLHLVRNAATHGLETPQQRAARGKGEALTISLRAATVGESVVLEVSDDGGGIDLERVRQRAGQAGLDLPESPNPDQVLQVLCLPGFSTKDQADLGAGRGVGMAVVKRTIAEVGGDLRLRSEPGRGTTFILRLPLTLAIADALLIGVGDQRFAVLQTGVQEIATVAPESIVRLENAEFMRYREGVLPIVRLARLFRLPQRSSGEHRVLVVGHGSERVGLIADRVLGQREIMIRAVSDPLFKIPAVSGATELGDGRPVLILDLASLVQMALKPGQGSRREELPEMSYA